MKKSTDFDLKIEVSTLFMECEKRLLFLQRNPNKISPNLWAIPGGKLNQNETPIEGVIREIMEELSLKLVAEEVSFLKSFYVRNSSNNYRLHLFTWKLSEFPKILLNSNEHQDYKWQPISKIHKLDLIEGQYEALMHAYGSAVDKKDFRS